MGQVDNLQEDLLKTKKSHAFDLSMLRTKIKILEKEVKKKDQQIDDLLKNDQFATKSEQKLQMNSLKRKVVQLERSVREKSEEVAKLLSDKNIAKAAEIRHQRDQLNIECARLRKHLSQSIPESEFLREKHQYMDIIGQLTDENIIMRKMIGELKSNQQDPKTSAFEQKLDEEAMMMEMKALTMAKKRDVEFYKNALNSLINQRNSTRNSHNGWDQKPPYKKTSSSMRSRSVNTNPDNLSRTAKVPSNKKFPIRSQPLLSKVSASRSKSIEESSAINQRRLSRQLSDANLTSISHANSDIDKQGHEILMPVKRKARNHVMYRNAIESDSSSEKEIYDTDHKQQLNDLIQEHQTFMDKALDSKDDDLNELPIELYDARGNVYYIQPEDEDDEEHECVAADPSADDSDILLDSNEISVEMKKRSTDTWLEIASLLSGQVNLDEESTIIRSLHSHMLRIQMVVTRYREE